MNEILQQRIEEAKQKEYPLPPMVDGAVCKVLAMAEQTAYKKGATFALQNQWISVEEALPVLADKNSGKSEVVFATTDYHYNIFVAYYDYSNDTWYYNNYPGYDPQIYYEVTHWMSIPSLKGGEE